MVDSAKGVRKAAPPLPPASSRAPEPPAASTLDTDVLNAGGEARGSSPAIHAVPSVGDRVDKYVVERVIGSGGMGLVVAARNEQLGELVAVKLLRPKAAGDRVHAERFAREARAIIKIKSEHVVRVLDAGTLESGAPYIVMEYLVGRDLAQVLRANGPMPWQVAADRMLQVCEAVASAHAVGVVHRDLKPSNFFETTRDDGSTLVKVLDFGISKAVGQDGMVDPNLTETQAVFGSPTYMSPEQIRSAKHVDQRSDVWSLGVCFYELVTGRLPFAGDNVAGLLASIVADPPFYPRAFTPALPEALEELLLHCLVKDPRKRVQSAAELAFRIAPFATPTAEMHSLLERLDRLVRSSQSTTTGPRLPAPLPRGQLAPPSSQPFLASHGAGGPIPEPFQSSRASFGPDPATSNVAFGSTGMDLSGEAPGPRRRAVTGAFVGAGIAVALVLGVVGAYELGTRTAGPPKGSASGAPPPPAEPTATVSAATPEPPPSASATPPSPPEPPASVSAAPRPAGTAKKPPKPHPTKTPPSTPTSKPVDPTGDRY